MINLTPDQQKAKDKIIEFLEDKNSQNIVIEGYAGTGKTTLVNYVLREYAEKGKKICVSAFTNKATNVIGMKTDFAKAITLFRLLGLRPNENSDKLEFDPQGEVKVGNFNVIVVDEVSMLSDKYLMHLLKVLEEYPTTKVIHMGDSMQLMPVKQESDSKIFQLKNKVVLKQVIRQAEGSDILAGATKIRQVIEKINDNKPVPPSTDIGLSTDVGDLTIYTDKKPFFKDMLDDFKSDHFRKNTDYVRTIAYRNKTINTLNGIIRNAIFGKDVDPLVDGDLLILNSPVYAGYGGSSIFETSDELYVDDIHFQMEYKQYHDGWWVEFPYYEATVIRMLDDKTYKLNIIAPQYKDEFESNMRGWAEMIKAMPRPKWKKFYDFKKKYHVPSYLYAITSHKSQGSTYDNVYLLEEDIDSVKMASQKNLWQSKYVAYSRASKKLNILQTKPKKFSIK